MTVAVVVTVGWVGCALWLAQKMKQDVDGMELAWMLAHSDPTLWGSLRPPKRRLRNRLRQTPKGSRVA